MVRLMGAMAVLQCLAASAALLAAGRELVLLAPRVGWEEAKGLCRRHGFDAAHLAPARVHEAAGVVRAAGFDAAWVGSYAGHGRGTGRAARLSWGGAGGVPAVRVMRRLPERRVTETHPVLCQER